MKRAGVSLLTIVILATLESALDRWLPSTLTIPLVLPLLFGSAFVLRPSALFRLSLLGAVASELMSGLAPGMMFAVTLLAPQALAFAFRQPRPELPWLVRGLTSTLAVFLVLFLINLTANWTGPLPPRLVPTFLLLRLLLPAVIAGGIAALVPSLLRRRWALGTLRLLGVPAP